MSSFIGRILVLGTAIAITVVVTEMFSLDFFTRILQTEFNATEAFDELKESNESSVGIFLIILAIISIIAALVLFFNTVLFTIRSTSEKAEQEVASRFSVKEKELRRQIEKEVDEEKKQALELQALSLRREYESLLSENLQKKDGGFVEDWREVLLVARKRLLDEEQRLQLRNAVNLAIGIVSVSFGVALLIIFLLVNDKAKDNSNFIDFLTIYWARIGIVITIGVFAGFFLRLYSLTERAIANNKNEITNIELRLTSGLLMSKKTSAKKFDSLADDLAKEERNFVLKKNETSAITDSDKLDIDRAVKIAIKAMKAGGI